MRWVILPKNSSMTSGERDIFLIAGISLALLILAAFVPLRWMPPCLFHRLTGLPCFGCGTARSIHLLIHGDITGAFLMQPLVTVLALVTPAIVIYLSATILLRLPRWGIRLESRRERTIMVWCAVGIVVLNWLYLVARAFTAVP